MKRIAINYKNRIIPVGKQVDFYSLLAVLVLLLAAGMLALASASAYSGANINEQAGDAFYFLKRQSVSLILGLIALFIMYRGDYHKLHNLAGLGLLVSGGLLLFLYFSPHAIDAMGARRGYALGPVSFQPTELAKISLAIWATGRSLQLKDKILDLNTVFWNICAPAAVLAGLVVFQPDLGSAMLICLIGLMAIFLAGAQLRHVGIMVTFLIVGAIGFIMIEPFRRARIVGLFFPQETSSGEGYQLMNSLYALASGKYSGVGYFNSHQKYGYIPAVHTDFIFSVWGEEFGFLGAVVLVSLFFAFFLISLRIASKADTQFGRNLAIVIGGYIFIQVTINLLSVVGLMPVTGVPLPFISYGGSSLIATMALVGVLLNISSFPARRNKVGGERLANSNNGRRDSRSFKSRTSSRAASN